MRKICLSSLVVLFFSLLALSPGKVKASHAMGVDITYQCLGGNQYEFTLNFYRDCAGATAPTSIILNLSSASCGANASVTLTSNGPGTEVSPLCPTQLSNSTCNSGTLPGVQQYSYSGIYTFTQQCPDWIVSWDLCCRNAMVTNLVTPSSQSMYLFSSLDNSGGLCNSSPVFSTLPVPYICAGQPFCYNHGAVDPDGDSLVYKLVNPLDGPAPGTPIPYNAPNNATYPLTDVNGVIFFDSLTGSMCVTPNGIQVAVVTIQVEEWRNNALIGTTMRDLQIVVQNCSNSQPDQVAGGIFNQTGGIQIDSNSVEVCPGDPLSFSLQFDDPNAADNITLTTNLGTSIPAATWTTSGTNPITANFSWTPTAGDIGFNSFTVTVQDDGCPILGSQVFAYDIRVLQGTYAGPDLNYCPAGGPVPITVAGGSVFTWNDISGGPAIGLSCTNCANPQASPAVTTTYVVTSNLSSTCKNRDTITVNRVPDFVLNPGSSPTICRYGAATLNPTATPGTFAPYTWAWTPGGSLSANNIQNPSANPLVTTEYFMTVTSNLGCTVRDSVTVTVSGVAPQVIIEPEDDICENETIQFETWVSQDCGTTTQACTGPSSTGTIGNGTSGTTTYGPGYLSTSTYSSRRQYIFTPAELNSMGFVQGGKITAIAFEFTTANDNITGATFRMGCTSRSDWNAAPYEFISGLTTVKNSFTLNPALGWVTIPLDFPYMWDGQSNLVVEFCRDNLQTGVGSSTSYTCVTGEYRCMYYNWLNNTGVCNYLPGSRTTCRPNMQFTFCEALPAGLTYAWTPSTGLSNSNTPNPSATVPATTTYTLDVTDGPCTGSSSITINAGPHFSLDAGPDTTVCRNVPVQLNATVPGTYSPYTFSWTTPVGLDNPNAQNPQATAPVTTTYKVSALSNLGCTEEDSLTITLSGVAPIVDAGRNDTICSVGGSTLLNPLIASNCGPTNTACSGPVTTGSFGIGTSSTTTYGPAYFFTSTAYVNRKQYIFSPDELNSMGFFGGRINSIALNYATDNDNISGLEVKMGCTTKNDWQLSTDTFVNGLVTVKNTFNYNPAVGWSTINLDNPYMWDGQSNLIIEFCTNAPQMGTASSVYYTCYTGLNRTLYYYSSIEPNGCSLVTGWRTTCRPDMQFSWCEALPPGMIYSWTPSASLSNSGTKSPTATPNVNQTYTLLVDDGSGCQGLDMVTVVMDTTNSVDVNSSATVVCPGDTINLDALVQGSPLAPSLPFCGVNGTTCSTTPYSGVVGTGTLSSSTYSPFYGTYTDTREQFLVTAAELNAAGLNSGTISEIGFNVLSKFSTGNFRNFTLSIGCTNASDLSVATGWLPTTVVWGAANYTTTTGWNNFVLNSPYDWDGVSNLVIEACFNLNNNGSISYDNVQYSSALGFSATMRAYTSANGSNGCNLAPQYVYTARPNINFTICSPAPVPFSYSWSPSAGLFNPAASNTDAIVSGPTTYTVTVSGGKCTVIDSVFVSHTCVLPVELFDFSGERKATGIHLGWETLTEQATSHFMVEWSKDGRKFEQIGKVEAAGFSQSTQTYGMMDYNPEEGINFYRLRIVDLDGEISLSDVVQVLWGDPFAGLEVYPIPVQHGQDLQVEFPAETNGKVRMDLTDLLGRVLLSQEEISSPGRNAFVFHLNGIGAGNYLLRISGREGSKVVRVPVTR